MAQKVDKKTELTFQTLERLKGSGPAYTEFIRAAKAYQKQVKELAEAGRVMAEALQKVGALHNGDLGDGIKKLAEAQRSIENKNEQICMAVANELLGGLERIAKPEVSEVTAFENDYKKVRSRYRDQISKLEGETKKAGKKGAQALQQSITALNDKVKEAEATKADKLRQILLLERKKYCNFLGFWISVANAQLDYHNEGVARLKENQTYWNNLSQSTSQLGQDMEGVIKNQNERTFVAIQPGQEDSYNYSSSWDTSYDNYSSSYNSYDSGYNSGYSQSYDQSYDQSYNQSYSQSYGTCTALYDFSGEQPDDLAFYAGSVITIIQPDDGSGWLHGELNGVRGIFPASYVRR